jgi:hypothetical protein
MFYAMHKVLVDHQMHNGKNPQGCGGDPYLYHIIQIINPVFVEFLVCVWFLNLIFSPLPFVYFLQKLLSHIALSPCFLGVNTYVGLLESFKSPLVFFCSLL